MSESALPTGVERTTPAVEGASVQVQYAKRIMRMYAINENEVRNIASYNSQATVYFSLASFLLSATVSIYANAIFYTDLTAAGQLAEKYVAPILVVVAIFSVF